MGWILVLTIFSTWQKPNVSVSVMTFDSKVACEQAYTESLRQVALVHDKTKTKFVHTGKCLPKGD